MDLVALAAGGVAAFSAAGQPPQTKHPDLTETESPPIIDQTYRQKKLRDGQPSGFFFFL
jgi:hypothetical protein